MAALLKIIGHIRGDTFSRAGFLPINHLYAGGQWIVKCDAVEKISGVRHSFVATLIPPTAPETRTMVHLFAPASAVQAWAVGKLKCDIEFIDTAAQPEPFKASSLTFIIALAEDVTQ